MSEKKYRYKSATIRFSWNPNNDPNEETTIKAEWEFETANGKKENHSYNRTAAQIDAFYVPLIRIVKGYDAVPTALLYLNDEYCKGIYLRLIEQGLDFLKFEGITLTDDNKWEIKK